VKGHRLSLDESMATCLVRMDFGEGLRCHFGETTDSSCLRARLIMGEHTAGRQQQGELLIGRIGR
jgi:hypothetical protein